MQIPEQSNSPEQSGQIAANPTSVVRRATGPRTQQGKEKSKRNALKHGIFSQVVLLKGEPRAELESLLNGLRSDLEPEGTLEELLVDKLAVLVWRHRRLIIAVGEQTQEGEGFMGWGTNILGDEPPVDLFLRYESNLERAFDRTLNQLDRQQRMRKGQPVPPTLNVNVSA